MSVDGEELLLTVDPQTLANHRSSAPPAGAASDERRGAGADALSCRRPLRRPTRARPPALVNAGLIHGEGGGAFVTGDLCPSRKPLDRAFIEEVAAQGPARR